jgi:putative ABC transport system substrate-binding protein
VVRLGEDEAAQLHRLVGSAAALWPRAIHAQQQDRIARVGYLGLVTASEQARGPGRAFGRDFTISVTSNARNLLVEYRRLRETRLPLLAADLVDLNVDVIITYATGVFAAQRATKTIPIVMTTATDVVAMGVVASLAHPGGNVTGLFCSSLT